MLFITVIIVAPEKRVGGDFRKRVVGSDIYRECPSRANIHQGLMALRAALSALFSKFQEFFYFYRRVLALRWTSSKLIFYFPLDVIGTNVGSVSCPHLPSRRAEGKNQHQLTLGIGRSFHLDHLHLHPPPIRRPRLPFHLISNQSRPWKLAGFYPD